MHQRRLFTALALLAALGIVAGCHKTEPEAFGSLTVDEVQKLVDAKQASVFDNNKQERWAKSHVPTATWLAFNDVKASDLPADKNRTLVFYCANTH